MGGRWAGTGLTSPAGRVRPTTEALRDAWLTHLEPHLEGARVLDLFAGSGALGLEALSRGAATVDFVENGAAALHALRANVARLRARSITRVFVQDALQFMQRLGAGAYDVAFADPPYDSTLAARIVKEWQKVPFAWVLGVEHMGGVTLTGGGRPHRVGEGAFTVYRTRKPPSS